MRFGGPGLDCRHGGARQCAPRATTAGPSIGGSPATLGGPRWARRRPVSGPRPHPGDRRHRARHRRAGRAAARGPLGRKQHRAGRRLDRSARATITFPHAGVSPSVSSTSLRHRWPSEAIAGLVVVLPGVGLGPAAIVVRYRTRSPRRATWAAASADTSDLNPWRCRFSAVSTRMNPNCGVWRARVAVKSPNRGRITAIRTHETANRATHATRHSLPMLPGGYTGNGWIQRVVAGGPSGRGASWAGTVR
jgi:hypothetical protein